MENKDEVERLEIKTDPDALRRQARWCGVRAGLNVLDLGCGMGKTSFLLHEMVQPGGSVLGVDFSAERIAYARKKYGGREGLDFLVDNLMEIGDNIGPFDLIWVRFVLEYYRRESGAIVKNLKKILKPGGYLCLLDLDHNCLNHYELPSSFAELLPKLMAKLDDVYNFDTFAGRKLYAYLYDEGYENIEVELMAHRMIYGKAKKEDDFNWLKKLEIASSRLQGFFDGYRDGKEGFLSDFETFFLNPRRFTYTPLILCKGMRPRSF